MVYIAEARSRRQAASGRGLPARTRSETPGSDPGLERRLAEARVSRAHRQSRIRTLLNQRNAAVAAALTGGVPVARIAAATGLRLTDVRNIGEGYSDYYGSGISREQHVTGLAAIAGELEKIKEERDRAERQFSADVVEALRGGRIDVFRVAALTAVTAERLRELTRGAGLRADAFRPRPA